MGSRIGWPPSSSTSKSRPGPSWRSSAAKVITSPGPNTVSWPVWTGRRSAPTVPEPASTYASALKSRRHGSRTWAPGATVAWSSVIGVCVMPGPRKPARSPAMSRSSAPPSAEDSSATWPARLTWRVVDLAHLVHVDERVEPGQVHPRECPADREAFTLEPGRRRGDRRDRAGGRGGGVGLRDAGQDQDVFDGDRWHDHSSASGSLPRA